MQRHCQRVALRRPLLRGDDNHEPVQAVEVKAALMAIRIEHKPRHLWSAQVVEPILGVHHQVELVSSSIPGLREQPRLFLCHHAHRAHAALGRRLRCLTGLC